MISSILVRSNIDSEYARGVADNSVGVNRAFVRIFENLECIHFETLIFQGLSQVFRLDRFVEVDVESAFTFLPGPFVAACGS